jgi:hypothetical protein
LKKSFFAVTVWCCKIDSAFAVRLIIGAMASKSYS